MIKKPRTRSRTITILERRAIRRPVAPARRLADPPTRRYADPFLPPPTRQPADPLPLASHLSPFAGADSPIRRPVSPAADPPTRRSASPGLSPSTFHLADTPTRRFADPFLPLAVPPIRRFADPFLPHPLSRLFACFAGPSVFVSPNGARRSLITLTGASLKWPL